MREIIMLGGSLVDGTGAVSLRNRELIGNRAGEMFLTGGTRAYPLTADGTVCRGADNSFTSQLALGPLTKCTIGLRANSAEFEPELV